MNPCPREEELAALVAGELRGEPARELERHVAACELCAGELAWLRSERKLFQGRAEASPPPPERVWAAIAERTGLQPSRRRVAGRRVAVVAGLFAVAAAAMLLWRAQRVPLEPPTLADLAPEPEPAPSPSPGPNDLDLDPEPAAGVAAVDRADEELDVAISRLQSEYAATREQIPAERAARYDREFAEAEAALAQARREARHDASARQKVLYARARYLRSMQAVVMREGKQ